LLAGFGVLVFAHLYALEKSEYRGQNAGADVEDVMLMWSTVRARCIAAEHSHEVFSWYFLLTMLAVRGI
jgi:hypothetical protein